MLTDLTNLNGKKSLFGTYFLLDKGHFITGTESRLAVNILHEFLSIWGVLGTRSRFDVTVLHRLLYLSRLLGTDSRFPVIVLHWSEKSRRTNQRKGTAVPKCPEYNERSCRTNQRKSAAVPKRPEYSERSCRTNQRKSIAVPKRPEYSERPWEQTSGKEPMYFYRQCYLEFGLCDRPFGLTGGVILLYNLFFIAQYSWSGREIRTQDYTHLHRE